MVLLGGFVPVVAAVVGLLQFAAFALRATASRSARTRGGTVALLVATLAPYSAWLAVYTLSGEGIRGIALRPLLIALATPCFLAPVAGATALWVWRSGRRAWWPLGLTLVLGVGGAFWVNHHVQPGEYEPLHQFVSVLGVLLAALAAPEIAGGIVGRLARRRSAGGTAVLAGVVGLLALLGDRTAANDPAHAWQVCTQSDVARFVFLRCQGSSDPATDPAGGTVGDGGAVGAVGAHPPGAAAGPTIRPILDTPTTIAERRRRADNPPPHMVLYFIDGVSSANVGAYGETKNRATPHIDELAREAVVFHRAYSGYPQTRVFMTSLLLGRAVPTFDGHRMPAAYVDDALTRHLDRRGYHQLVKGHFEGRTRDTFDSGRYAIDRAFHPMTPKHPRRFSGARTWREMTEDAQLDAVAEHVDEARRQGAPAFIWIHQLHPHRNQHDKTTKFYTRGPPRFGDSLPDLHDSAIAEADDWFGRLREIMSTRGGDRPVVWIIGSDHGSEYRKVKGKRVGRTLSDADTQVPLIIAAPGFEPRRVDDVVEVAIDVAATVADLAGITPPPAWDGVSLVPLMAGAHSNDRLIPLAYKRWIGAVYQDWKLVHRPGASALYDMGANANANANALARPNLAAQRPKLLARLLRTARKELARRTTSFRQGLNSAGDKTAGSLAP